MRWILPLTLHASLFSRPRPITAMAFLVATVGLAGCETGPGSFADEPEYGGTAVVAGPLDLQTANPLTVTESWTQDLQLHALFLPLVRRGPDGEYEPALAREWEAHGDTAVTFRLREDVRWHDGAPTTAHDVAFTFERAVDPAVGFPSPDFFSHWSDPVVVDSFTIRFRSLPQIDRMLGWSQTGIVPRHLLESVPPGEMDQAAFNAQPVGNGPFRFVSHTINDRWVFEANPEFPEALGGRPYLDRLVWRVVPENEAQVTELLTGNAHLITAPRADRLAALAERDDIRAIVRPTRKYLFIGWNGRRDPLGDPDVRLALTHAVDRHRILQATRAGYGRLGTTPVPPSHFAYDSTLDPVSYDTARARALLADAGFVDADGDGYLEGPDGRDLAIELKIPANNAFNRDVAELLRGDLERVGVRLTTRPTEGATLIDDMISPERRFDAVLMGLEADMRLELRPLFHSAERDGPFQLAGYADPAVDAVLDSIAAATDRAASARLWSRLQRRLRHDQPWTVLWFSPDLMAARAELRGTDMDSRGAFVHVTDWWLATPAVDPGPTP